MRFLLLPISLLYHIVLFIRHKLYDWHLLKSKRFDLPVICVGNLTLGGTGKTPLVEFLVDFLSTSHRVCIVSRGYGRKTRGFQLAHRNCCAETIGDEPMQYVSKFNDVMVAVDENRNRAIELMNTLDRPPEVYLLDDAFQHRSTQAGLNILLTAYDKLYCDDYLLPTGTLRDIKGEAKRADLILVTKTPHLLDEGQKAEILTKLHPLPHQSVYFSSLEYAPLKAVSPTASLIGPENADAVLLFCGIAQPQPLFEVLKHRFPRVETMTFPDHHPYSKNDVEDLLKHFRMMEGTKKILVTTEKDVARFINSPYLCMFDSEPFYVAPIKTIIDEEEKFKLELLNYVRENAHHC